MSDSIIVVMAHRESTECLIRHWPLWAAHKLPIMVFAPADSIPRIDPSIPMLLYGRAEHHGVESVRRFKWLLNFLEGYNAESYWIFEYDAYCLDPNGLHFVTPVIGEGRNRLYTGEFYGGVFNIGEDDPSFKGSFYVHPPFGMNLETLQAIKKLNLPETQERGFYDRWLGYVMEILCDKSDSNIRMRSWIENGSGFSRNTIEPEDRVAAVAAVEQGVVWIHGCKTEETLTAIKAAYARRVTK